MLDNLQEWGGYACLVAFGFFVWHPAALLVAGVILIVTSNMRAASRKPGRMGVLERAARAVVAFRSASDRSSS